MANDDIIVTELEEISIKNKAPDKLPLNPTAQGFSGQEIRKRLAGFVIDNDASILQLVKEKLALIKDKLDVLDDKTEGIFEELDVGTLTIGDAELTWSEVDGTINVQLNEDFSLKLGQQLVYYGKAHQVNISVGDPVMFAGVEGNHFRLAIATPNIINSNPEYFIGVAAQNIAVGEFGYVTEFGVVEGFNAPIETYSIGDVIWYDSVNGGYTTTKPPRGNAQIRVAAILKVNQNQNQLNTGKIFVRPSIIEGGSGDTNLFVSEEEPTATKLNNDIWFDL
jgi:hypothetical protein